MPLAAEQNHARTRIRDAGASLGKGAFQSGGVFGVLVVHVGATGIRLGKGALHAPSAALLTSSRLSQSYFLLFLPSQCSVGVQGLVF
jgi:hypothetical protein